MKFPVPSVSRFRTSGSAFVLVAVLLLIALVTVLVAVTSILARIERKAVQNATATNVARQNALFGLNVALAQLQKEAGPDQRITARSDILDSNAATPAIDGVNQPYWTGVWKTGVAPLDVATGGGPQRQTSFGSTTPSNAQKSSSAKWLISNPTPVTALDPVVGLTAGIKTATVAKNLPDPSSSAAAGAKVDIKAPLVPMQKGSATATIGNYAYWVCDEGIKAKVNLKDPTLGVDPTTDASRSQLHFFAPQANAMHKGLLGTSNTTDVRGSAQLSKVTTLQSMGLVTGMNAASLSGNAATAYLPDATTVSRGVLADVRRGGLKKDLTAAMEDPAKFSLLATNYGYGAGQLYRSASSAGLVIPVPADPSTPPNYYTTTDSTSTPPVDGLSWYSLYCFYNSYKGTMPALTGVGSGGVAPVGSGTPSARPQVISPRVYNIQPTAKIGSIAPIPIAYRVDLALSSYNAGTATTPEWRLRLHYYPQLVLWNPYAVRLSLNSYQFRRDLAAFSGAGSWSATNPTVTCMRVISTTSGTTTTGDWFRVNQISNPYFNGGPSSNPNYNPNGRLTLQTKLGDAAVLEPGETRVFALDQDSPKADPQAAIKFSDLVSNPNMSPDWSQQCDVLLNVDTTSTGSNAQNFLGYFKDFIPFKTSDPNTLIDIKLSAASLRCQNSDTFILPQNLKWPYNDSSAFPQGRYLVGGSWDLKAATTTWTPVTIPPTLPPTISQLSGAPRRIIGFYIRQKGLVPSASIYTYSNASSSVPLFMGNYPALSPVDDNFSYVWQEVYLSALGTAYANGATDVQSQPAGSYWETTFGDQSAGAGGNINRYVLSDVPNQPMVSLGQLMHMNSMNVNSVGDFQMMNMGSMFVGGSCASPGIPTNYNALGITVGVSGTPPTPNRRIFLDDSFLSNEALFDRFFLSTLPPQTLNAGGTTYPPTWTAFNAANSSATLSDSTKPLLNSRIKPYFANGNAPKLADLRDVDKAASNLFLDGAFNVNSTSILAWKAFLYGLSGNDLNLWNANVKGERLVSPAAGNPFSRFWSGSGNTAANQLGSGLRVLSNDEITELATRIVEQVKTRGPFLSMADFLNRRLGPATDSLNRCGALQAAIDNTSPDVNATIKNSGVAVNASAPTENPQYRRAPDLIPANMKDTKGIVWNTTIGAPGYLMQQDLVQALSPAMMARSDTFTVRCYGEQVNKATGLAEGKAWGEAVVQRLPDLVDAAQPAETSLASMNSTNTSLGRRFKVVSFRWLNEAEL